ncbi:ABC transporter permease [Mucilaginibacter sp.]|uniref:ABC transporter permease n=1 Tax=Mucilaginibacter sp. TaxID=1882438 RepID=UPI0035BBF8C5
MLKNYFKIAWRNIVRHKGYSLINISGLSVGIAACLLIFVVLQFELSFNKSFEGYKNIYHFITEQHQDEGTTYNPGTSPPAINALRNDFPQIKFAAVNSSYGSQLTVPGNDANDLSGAKKFTEPVGVFFMEPQFFDIFSSQWLTGNKDVLSQPNMVVIDKSTATKYFGDWKDVVGRTLKMDNVLTLKVAGVVADAPTNSDFPLKVMVSYITWKQHPKDYGYADSWDNTSSNNQIFLKLPENIAANQLTKQLVPFTKKYVEAKGRRDSRVHVLQPLTDLHFDTRVGNTLGDHLTSKSTLRTLSFIAVLIIVMASINFINLSTAQSVGRSKEVGIRKVLGSTRKQLIAQVIGETSLVVLFSVLLAIAIAKIALPYLKHIASVPDNIGLFSLGTVLFLIVTMVLVILLSGIYPALVVSGFKPVLAIKNKITAASIGGIPLRRALVVAQFAIAQLLIIGTLVAVNQMNFVNQADLGFNKNAILVLPGYTDSISLSKLDAFKQQLLQKPGVKSVSFSSDPPSSDNNWGQNFYFNRSEKDLAYVTFLKYGDADYFKTYGMKFAAGKGYDQADTTRQAVVNETFIHKLGIQKAEDAIGKDVKLGSGRWVPIVGVVKDFKTNSLRDAVKPIVITARKKFESQAAVKIETRNLSTTVADIRSTWEATYPEYAYNGYFLDENIAKFYQQENQLALVYKIFAIIAIFISCLGLYGLVSFMAVQRTKEVGVRKVLGASVFSIVMLFSKEFMILIAISFFIAMPAAWYMMSEWLQNFAYRIPLTAGVFVLAIVGCIGIAWITVGYKAVRAALVNPVKSLKSE